MTARTKATVPANDYASTPRLARDAGDPARVRRPRPKLQRAAQVMALTALLCIGASSCTSVAVERDSLTSGTFTSRAWAITFFGMDIPRPALMVARGNAADIQRPDMRIVNEWVRPDLYWFDWLLEIVGVRFAKVEGTWGLPDGGGE